MKKFLIMLVCTLVGFTQAQVGIGTNDPQSTLDVNGSITIRDKIYTGGSDTSLGNPGAPGQVLVSAGKGDPPMWKSLNVPDIQPGDFYLIYTNAFFDETGLFLAVELPEPLYTRGVQT